MRYFFYSMPAEKCGAIVPAEFPEGYTPVLWRASSGGMLPPGAGLYPYAAFWLMHRTRVFGNGDYAVFLLFHGLKLVHESAITPPDFRYRFMGKEDLQIGNVFTAPEHRGRGLTVAAIRSIVHAMRAERRTFWWVTDEANTASQRAVEKAGFHLQGTGVRRDFLRVPFFVSYRILHLEESVAAAGTREEPAR